MAITNKELADLLGTVTVGANHTETLNTAYQAAFGRDADAEGIAYWSNELTNGLSVSNLLEALLNGADAYVENTEYPDNVAKNTADKAVIANKSEVVEYAKTVNLSDAKLTTFLADVTADAATVTTVKSTIDADVANDDTSVVGSTITFTDKIDTLVGTSGDDIFVGDAATLVSADQVAGGAGNDTAKLYDVAAQSDIPTMTSIENIEMINAADASIDLSSTGATNLTFDNQTDMAAATNTLTISADQKLTIKNLAGGEDIYFTTTATDTTVDLTVDKVGTKAAAHTLVDVVGAGITTLNLTSTGTASYLTGLTASTATALTNLVVSGDASVSVATALIAATTNVDASAMTAGGLTVTVDAAAKTLTGGAGDDTFKMAADSTAAALIVNMGAGNDTFDGDTVGDQDFTDTNTVIDGGEGIDTLVVADAKTADFNKAKNNNMAEVTNFEVFKVITADTDFDMDFITAATGATDVTIVDNAAIAISNMANGSTLTVDGTATGIATVTVKNAGDAGSTSDVLNIKLANAGDDAAPDATVTVADVETINIETVEATATAVSGDVNLMELVANDALTINITGNEDLDLDETTTSFTAAKTVDASGLDGKLTISLATAGQGVTFTGTAKDDTVTSSGNVDSITLGAGQDTIAAISAGAKVTDFTFGAGGDILDISGLTNQASASAGLAKAEANGTTKVIAENSTDAVAFATAQVLAISVETAADYDTLAEINTLFGAGKEFEAVANNDEIVLMISAADTGDTYVYSMDETTGAATVFDAFAKDAVLVGVSAADLDGAVAANFI